MASNNDLVEQLALIEKINAALQTMAQKSATVKSSYEQQMHIAQKTMQVMQQIANTNMSETIGSLNDKLSETAEKLDEADQDPFKSLSKSLKAAQVPFGGLLGKFKLFNITSLASIGILSGVRQGFRSLMAFGKSLWTVISKATDIIFSLGAAIISLPFKALGKIVDIGAKSQGFGELRTEIEAVRKQFGSLSGPSSKAVLDTTRNLKGFSDTGLHAFRIFGNLAQRLQHVREVATELGPTFDKVQQEFTENGGAILAYQKGLGISNESLKAIAARSISFGTSMTKTLNDVAKQSLRLGEQFGISQKLISRDVVNATKDVAHFGAVTVKEISVAAVYARKLGVELKDITGTLDAFETFDQAAENSAKLSQSFGVQVDAFKMMSAQNPADQIDMLRKQFRSAGVDASSFNRQQLKLLASSTGLDVATVQQAFSAKNYGVSLEDVRKKAELNEKKQLSQAEAMSKLADSIERLIKDGPALKGSFFDMFLDGINRGIQVSPEFLRLMRNIRFGLRQVMMIGVQLGRALVKGNFFGLGDIIGGLADLFKPEKFKAVAQMVNKSVLDLLNNKISFKTFADNLYAGFNSFMGSESGAISRIASGFGNMLSKLASIVGPMITQAGVLIGTAFRALGDLLSGKKSLPSVDPSGPLAWVQQNLWEPIKKGFVDGWPHIKEGFLALWKVLKVEVPKFFKEHPELAEGIRTGLWGIFSFIIGTPVFSSGITAMLAPVILKAVAESFLKWSAGALAGVATAFFAKVAGAMALAGVSFATLLVPILAAALGVAIGWAFQKWVMPDSWKANLESAGSKIYDWFHGTSEDKPRVTPEEWKKMQDAEKARAEARKKAIEEATKAAGPPAPPPTAQQNAVQNVVDKLGISGIAADNVGDRVSAIAKQVETAQKSLVKIQELTPKINALVSAGVVSGIAESVTKIGQQLQKLNIAIASEFKMIAFGTILETVAAQMSVANSSINKMQRQSNSIKDKNLKEVISPVLTATQDIIAQVQTLDNALAKLPTVDVSARLKTLASNVGLGTKGVYTVASKNVEVTVNLSVTMEVDKVEQIMIMRKESIIRDRLNFATSKPQSPGTGEIPDAPTSGLPLLNER